MKLNSFDKFKVEKDGLVVKIEIEYFVKIGWEVIDKIDCNYRFKWLGVFFRFVILGKFMLWMCMFNGMFLS